MKKYPIGIFVIVILGLVCIAGYRYKDYMIDGDFILSVNTICDVESESCFDPETDYSFDEFPYKKIEMVARNAPPCIEEHTCEIFSCEGLESCTEIYCSEETKWEGEMCLEKSPPAPTQTDPNVILEDNI